MIYGRRIGARMSIRPLQYSSREKERKVVVKQASSLLKNGYAVSKLVLQESAILEYPNILYTIQMQHFGLVKANSFDTISKYKEMFRKPKK
ncbi:hypothetical protein GDO78_008852 [Eleutherodactylus coqui]|uniref:Uncharacterized protein n=1 Tax=Eleutherodactylus coqui TaxID=57060 RepID=A0A8J6KBU9_ELECQ|nr:hypothetical protein GDO78_008852 [Eleutherodactylus coqui]